jgi:two-component system, chemotaxis family, chemotaxis protein CheY
MRFLIIDDQIVFRKLMELFLAEYGTSDMASDGYKGLTMVLKAIQNETNYDAIFLDIMMAGLEGHKVLQKIRELEKSENISPPNQTKVIMVSAHEDSENIMGAFNSQADAYLVKPVMKEKLRAAMLKAGVILPTQP